MENTSAEGGREGGKERGSGVGSQGCPLNGQGDVAKKANAKRVSIHREAWRFERAVGKRESVNFLLAKLRGRLETAFGWRGRSAYGGDCDEEGATQTGMARGGGRGKGSCEGCVLLSRLKRQRKKRGEKWILKVRSGVRVKTQDGGNKKRSG